MKEKKVRTRNVYTQQCIWHFPLRIIFFKSQALLTFDAFIIVTVHKEQYLPSREIKSLAFYICLWVAIINDPSCLYTMYIHTYITCALMRIEYIRQNDNIRVIQPVLHKRIAQREKIYLEMERRKMLCSRGSIYHHMFISEIIIF